MDFYEFSLIFKAFIDSHKYANLTICIYIVICMSDHVMKCLYLRFNLVSSLAEDIYTAAGWESVYKNGYLHGSPSRFSAKSAIYTAAGCQHEIAIYMATIPEQIQVYTRLQCVHIKSLYTRQPFKSHIGYIHCCWVYTKIVIYTAAVQVPNRLYTLLPGVYITLLFTRQPFKTQIGYIHCCQVYNYKIVKRQPFKSQIRYIHRCRVYK